jgi:hypothetical protein
MKSLLFSIASLIAMAAAVVSAGGGDRTGHDERAADERLSFQTSGTWSPRTNLNADVVMVYGIGPDLPAKIETWRQHGYIIHVMTGVAWGNYQDYLYGRYDGKDHWDQAQRDRAGNIIGHGVDIPYISPGENYGKYLTVGVKRALDAGAEAIYLEEPEFWARSGWEENFKHEWMAYYHEEWQAPNSSPDAQYRTSKLKYYLYRRALAQIFEFAKEYGKAHGRTIRCYVPTHSLINYAHWGIVSPESSLINVGGDGFIAQVWTGTARTPNVYEGRRKERTFETAFLEYGAMQNLVRASKSRVWYLNDPIEDNPDHDWGDYRRNWENTLTASLLQPEVWRYEIMPWPDRIFNGTHPAAPSVRTRTAVRRSPGQDRVPIPREYETELQTVIRALGEMKQPAGSVKWLHSGTPGVGVLVSDTMMFQRADPTPSDENLGSFYGLAMPLLKRGMPVEPVQIESAGSPGFLKRYKMLLLTYEGQKPPTPAFHTALVKWVRDGGALVVVDDDHDPYNAARDWWNTAPLSYRTPREHLFAAFGLPVGATGAHRVGRGMVVYDAVSPTALTYKTGGADILRRLTRTAADAVKLPWKESCALVLRRGPYIVASGLDESVPEAKAEELHGRFIDLFDADLPILTSATLAPGRRALLFDLDAVKPDVPKIVAAACRVRDENADAHSLQFQAEGIANTRAVVRIVSRSAPSEVRIDGKPADAASYDYANGTLRLRFENSVELIPIEIRFPR